VGRTATIASALVFAAAALSACVAENPEVAGSRSFQRQMALEDSGATSANVSVGDLDGDGHLDVVLVKGRHWPLENRILLGGGKGGFQTPYSLGGPPDRSYSGDLVDLDGDGDLDVVVSNDDPDPKRVHLNRGDGTFEVSSTFGRGEWPTRHIAVVDLNGDRLPDVVLANRYGQASGPSYICFGTPGGGFGEDCPEISTGSATTITAGDVNGDGAMDLVVPHRDGGQSYVLLNDGTGRFPERRPFGPPDAAIRSARPSDMNGDGIVDLAVIDQRTGPAVLWGRADGSYTVPVPLGDSGATPYALAVADLDRDGRPDVIVGHVQATPVVYFNEGAGSFTPVSFGDAEGTAYGFAFGDVDEDGFLDIAMARSDAPNMLYFGGAAAGTPGR